MLQNGAVAGIVMGEGDEKPMLAPRRGSGTRLFGLRQRSQSPTKPSDAARSSSGQPARRCRCLTAEQVQNVQNVQNVQSVQSVQTRWDWLEGWAGGWSRNGVR